MEQIALEAKRSLSKESMKQRFHRAKSSWNKMSFEQIVLWANGPMVNSPWSKESTE